MILKRANISEGQHGAGDLSPWLGGWWGSPMSHLSSKDAVLLKAAEGRGVKMSKEYRMKTGQEVRRGWVRADPNSEVSNNLRFLGVPMGHVSVA